MRETPDARQAFNDYLAMGPDRSLEKLVAVYQSDTENAPTTRLRTLKAWSAAHQWQTHLADIADAERLAIVARGIADKQNRVDALNDRWERMKQVIAERAESREYADAAGGETGLLVKTYKQVGSGENAQLVEEYAVDTGLLREMREHEKQAAQELGQWTEKQEIAGKDGGPIRVARELTDDELAVIASQGGARATESKAVTSTT